MDLIRTNNFDLEGINFQFKEEDSLEVTALLKTTFALQVRGGPYNANHSFDKNIETIIVTCPDRSNENSTTCKEIHRFSTVNDENSQKKADLSVYTLFTEEGDCALLVSSNEENEPDSTFLLCQRYDSPNETLFAINKKWKMGKFPKMKNVLKVLQIFSTSKVLNPRTTATKYEKLA